jgi:hypothetical protein
MHFDTKSYLKNTRNHTAKHACLQPHVRSYLEQRPEKGSNLKKNEVYLCGNINVQSKILLHLMIKPYYKKLFLHQSVNYKAY